MFHFYLSFMKCFIKGRRGTYLRYELINEGLYVLECHFSDGNKKKILQHSFYLHSVKGISWKRWKRSIPKKRKHIRGITHHHVQFLTLINN